MGGKNGPNILWAEKAFCKGQSYNMAGTGDRACFVGGNPNFPPLLGKGLQVGQVKACNMGEGGGTEQNLFHSKTAFVINFFLRLLTIFLLEVSILLEVHPQTPTCYVTVKGSLCCNVFVIRKKNPAAGPLVDIFGYLEYTNSKEKGLPTLLVTAYLTVLPL